MEVAKKSIKLNKKHKPLSGNEKVWILMLLPATVLTIIFGYLPMFGIIMAFQDFDFDYGFLHSEWVGLQNFATIFKDDEFLGALKNTVIIAGWEAVLGILVPLIVALLVNEISKKFFTTFVKTSIFLPYFLSWVVLGGILEQFLGEYGPVNMLLSSFGLQPVLFLQDNNVFRGVLISTHVWKSMGYNFVIFLAALTAIDPSLYETAKIDGANRFSQAFHVTIPGIAPIVLLVSLLAIGGLLNAGFDQVFILENPAVYATGDILDTLVYRIAFGRAGVANFSLSAAVGLFKSIINLFLVGTSYFLVYKFSNYRIF